MEMASTQTSHSTARTRQNDNRKMCNETKIKLNREQVRGQQTKRLKFSHASMPYNLKLTRQSAKIRLQLVEIGAEH